MNEPREDGGAEPVPNTERQAGAGAVRETRLGKYRIVGRLGHGGMGVVFEAIDTALERRVAIKILPKTVARDPEMLRRFHVEARAAARLSHPNTIGVHEIAQDGGYHYLVQELIRGPSAQERLASGPLSWTEATRILADACRGLAAAHAAGILHRDVKPSNILCATDGSAKLGDFGLAKFTDVTPTPLPGVPAALGNPITASHRVLGTPHYMSPEQCRGERVDDLSDVYSLGATYFALLTGRHPFDGSAMEVMYAHCSRPTPEVRACNPAVPAACADIVRRAMSKEPMDRFASAAAMLAELEAVLATSRPTATPATSAVGPLTERSDSRNRRLTLPPRRWLVAGGGVALAGLVVVVFLGTMRGPRSTNSADPLPDAWRPLFNDRDLSGWKALGGRDSNWSVQDHQIVGRGDNAFLATERDDYQDFRLRTEVQLDAGGNSGVFFRCDDDVSLPAGYEAQIGTNLGSLHRNRLPGPAPPWRPELTAEPGRWHQLEIRAQGPHIEIFVDNKQIIDYREREPVASRGRIALQAFGEGTLVRFRRLEILELPR